MSYIVKWEKVAEKTSLWRSIKTQLQFAAGHWNILHWDCFHFLFIGMERAQLKSNLIDLILNVLQNVNGALLLRWKKPLCHISIREKTGTMKKKTPGWWKQCLLIKMKHLTANIVSCLIISPITILIISNANRFRKTVTIPCTVFFRFLQSIRAPIYICSERLFTVHVWIDVANWFSFGHLRLSTVQTNFLFPRNGVERAFEMRYTDKVANTLHSNREFPWLWPRPNASFRRPNQFSKDLYASDQLHELILRLDDIWHCTALHGVIHLISAAKFQSFKMETKTLTHEVVLFSCLKKINNKHWRTINAIDRQQMQNATLCARYCIQ